MNNPFFQLVLHNISAHNTVEKRENALKRDLRFLKFDHDRLLLKREFLINEEKLQREKNSKMSVLNFDTLKKIGTINLTDHSCFGTVKLVKDKSTGEVFIMKECAKNTVFNTEGLSIKQNSFPIATEFSDWLVRLFYTFQGETQIYYVMEYLSNCTLDSVLTEIKMPGYILERKMLGNEDAKFYFAEIVLAIEEVHKLGIIHADIRVLIFNIAL
jgi:serine/threonine protein kinase